MVPGLALPYCHPEDNEVGPITEYILLPGEPTEVVLLLGTVEMQGTFKPYTGPPRPHPNGVEGETYEPNYELTIPVFAPNQHGDIPYRLKVRYTGTDSVSRLLTLKKGSWHLASA